MKRWKPAAHKRYFENLNFGLKKIGLEPITSFLTTRDIKRKDLKPPKVPRIKETKNQISYHWERDGYKLIVHSSYNPNLPNGKSLGGFSSLGRISVLVVDNVSDDKQYQIYFSRAGAFVDRTLKEVAFLKHSLEERPSCPVCDKLMMLHQSELSAWWACENTNHAGRKFLPYRSLPLVLQKHRDTLSTYKKYYEKVTRKKTPRKRMRTIRKRWLKKKSAA